MMFLSGGSLYGQHMAVDDDKSSLWIEGRSNVNTFSCDANKYDVNSQRIPAVYPENSATDNLQIEVSIQVKGFDCGKKRMNRDLYEALKADEFKAIHFEYKSTEEVEYDEESDVYRITVNGLLTVAGETNNIQFSMNGFLKEDGTIRAKGDTVIEMTDYNVEPPTAMFGIVRVNSTLTVHFDLTAAIVE